MRNVPGILRLVPAMLLLLSVVKAEEPKIDELREKAEEGDAKSQWLLARAYIPAWGVINGYRKESERLFSQATESLNNSASKNDPDIQYMLGFDYLMGYGIPRSKTKAVEYFGEASSHDHILATLRLAAIYRGGDIAQRDMALAEKYETKAVKLLLESANSGDSESMLQLAKLYIEGKGVTKDAEEAIKWLTNAGEHDNPEAQNFLAGLFFRGGFIPYEFKDAKIEQDYAKALSWYSKAAKTLKVAAEHDNVVAQYKLGYANEKIAACKLLMKRSDGLLDNAEANFWYMKAAYRGHYLAQMCLSSAYLSGKGVKQDEVEGMAWELVHVACEKELDSPSVEDSVDNLRRTELFVGADIARLARPRSEEILTEIHRGNGPKAK